MTVAEMIAWLQTQDQGATVEVVVSEYSVWSRSVVAFDPVAHAEYADMRGNPRAIGTPYENDRTLYIGSC